ncbi:hypothetical protein E0H75_12490 [Kribbella capetownensis]|uniref:Uncharacterized protein n=1 Tax=Kribbella capetownensis TaxID=1572659 RepID=A0A4V2M8C4_9ACTN|nr:hypothetical protein [Kribbella capetownensis]TCC50962.1 hypothetical protein E0H75_12490 [Kribbella capetownensis]
MKHGGTKRTAITDDPGLPGIAVDGRRRSLPALAESGMYPQATFDADFHRVVNWWRVSTDPAARVQPPKQTRDRLTPRVYGLILGVLIVVVTFIIAYLRS